MTPAVDRDVRAASKVARALAGQPDAVLIVLFGADAAADVRRRCAGYLVTPAPSPATAQRLLRALAPGLAAGLAHWQAAGWRGGCACALCAQKCAADAR